MHETCCRCKEYRIWSAAWSSMPHSVLSWAWIKLFVWSMGRVWIGFQKESHKILIQFGNWTGHQAQNQLTTCGTGSSYPWSQIFFRNNRTGFFVAPDFFQINGLSHGNNTRDLIRSKSSTSLWSCFIVIRPSNSETTGHEWSMTSFTIAGFRG